RRERARLVGAEQRIGAIAALLHHHQFATDRECSGAGIGLASREKRCIGAAFGDALQNACGIAEQRLRPEIEGNEGAPASAPNLARDRPPYQANYAAYASQIFRRSRVTKSC